jgi:predicted dehydrogenase
MKCAIIGYGYWGKIMYRYIEKSSYFDVVSICTSSKLNTGIPYFIRDIEYILKNSKIECVFICTPIDTHFNIAKQALLNGKHVFCEKPLSKNSKEVKELAHLAIKKGRVIFTDYIYTVSDSINKMKKLISQVGKLKLIKSKISQFGNFYKDDDVYEVVGVHMVSAIFHILNDFINYQYIEVEYDDFVKDKSGKVLDGRINVFLDKNTKFLVDCSLISLNRERHIEIIGEDGIIKFDMLEDKTLKLAYLDGKSFFPLIKDEKSWCFDERNNIEKVLCEFYECINCKEAQANIGISLEVTKVLEKKDRAR